MSFYTITETSFKKNQNKKSVPLPYLLPQTAENKIFYENGLSHLIPRLTVKVHSSVEECNLLWKKFSKKQTLFDEWDFRYAWYEGYQCPLYFYTVYEGKKPLAVLPLWYDDEKKQYLWFGSDWMENNYFFVEDPKFINLLLRIIPRPFFLNGLKEKSYDIELDEVKVIPDDHKFFKNIRQFSHIDAYLATLGKKHRYNLKRDYQRIMDLSPRIEISNSSDFNEFKHVIELSKHRFAPEDENDLEEDARVETYRAILKNSGTYKTKFIKVYIQNYLAAVDFNILYKNIYYTPRGANDIHRFPGIGNFMTYLEFEDAIKDGFGILDCLQIDYSWKHKYFDAEKMVSFEKKM